jgi:hypothetical protein
MVHTTTRKGNSNISNIKNGFGRMITMTTASTDTSCQNNLGNCSTAPRAHFAVDDDNKIQYLERLSQKQLDLYDWNETKVNTLVLVDSVLLGAATLYLDKINIMRTEPSLWFTLGNIILVLVLLLPLCFSLIIALFHIADKMSSGKANSSDRLNHRAISKIDMFKTNFDYIDEVRKLTASQICEDLCNQIYGMNKNILKTQKTLKKAVYLDIIGLVGFVFTILYIIIVSR